MTKTEKPYTPPVGDYQGAELKRGAGIPVGRMRAFDLPSRVSDLLYYPAPARRVEPFPH